LTYFYLSNKALTLMSSPSEEVFKLRSMQLGTTALGMTDFAARLIWRVQCGGTLDLDSLVEIGNTSLLTLKSTTARGFSYEEQAAILNKATQELEQLMGSAITRGLEDPDKSSTIPEGF
jgi:hypothetical protein